MSTFVIDYVIYYLCIVVFFWSEVLLLKVIFNDLCLTQKCLSDFIYGLYWDDFRGIWTSIEFNNFLFHIDAELALDFRVETK